MPRSIKRSDIVLVNNAQNYITNRFTSVFIMLRLPLMRLIKFCSWQMISVRKSGVVQTLLE